MAPFPAFEWKKVQTKYQQFFNAETNVSNTTTNKAIEVYPRKYFINSLFFLYFLLAWTYSTEALYVQAFEFSNCRF